MFEFARQALGGLASEWRRQRAIRVLGALNDHLLDDIGLRRDQLPSLMLTTEKRKRAPAAVYHPELLHCG
jgi:uncharacterized protein YjiS (DUF1127 family)